MLNLAEAAVIERLIPELEADGFQVFAEPDRLIVPPFLGDYRPDLIALRSDRKLAIEVADRGTPAGNRIDQVARLFQDHPEWEFRLVWINSERPPGDMAPQSLATIEKSLNQVDRLLESGDERPAFLLAWAVLEALGRLLVQDRFKKPQTPGRLIEVMAAEGLLVPGEADFLRNLYPVRNALVHGSLDVETDQYTIRHMLVIMRSMIVETRH